MHTRRNLLNVGRADNCCYVAVMGMSGSGKTRFVANLLGQQNLSGDNSLRGGTKRVAAYTLNLHGQDIQLLDTPGFDNIELSDTDVVDQVKLYIQQRSILDDTPNVLAGVIYLHRISSPRFAGSSVGALASLRKLCGDQTAASCVVVLTTFWDGMKEQAGKDRESELRLESSFLKNLLDDGASLQRAPESASEKRAVLAALLKLNKETVGHARQDHHMSGTWPGLGADTRTRLPIHIESVDKAWCDSPSTDPELLTALSPLFEAERAALNMREAALKRREECFRTRELEMVAEVEQQKKAATIEQVKLQQKFASSRDRDLAAFQSALAAERTQQEKLTLQIRELTDLYQAQSRLGEAKDKQILEMSDVLTDVMAITARTEKEQLRTIGASHKTELYFHQFRHLGEIWATFAMMVIANVAKDHDKFDLSKFSQQMIATETRFDTTMPCCDPVAFLTLGTWRCYLWAGSADFIVMSGVKFRTSNKPTPDASIHEIVARLFDDKDGEAFDFSGTLDVTQAHANGRMVLKGRFSSTTSSFLWDLRVSHTGLLGIWNVGRNDEKMQQFWTARHSAPGDWDDLGGVVLLGE